MRSKKAKIFLAILLLALVLAPATASAVAQRRVKLEYSKLTVDMADGTTLQLNASVLPANASQRVVWRSSKPSVAKVSSTGLVRFLKPGTAVIGVRPRTVSRGWVKCTIVVKDSLRPTGMTLSSGNADLAVGSQMTLTASLTPASAIQDVRYVTSKKSVATVTQSGVITARSVGTANIRVYSTRNASLYRTIRIRVTTLPAPARITISPEDKTMNRGDTLQLVATGSPASASQSFGWKSSNTAIASVTQNGLVTAKKTGRVRITCYSMQNKSVKTVRTITVLDPNKITQVTLSPSGASYLEEGEELQLTAKVLPAGASQAVTWRSSNSSAAIVTDGKVVAKGSGTAAITASSAVDPAKKASVSVTVLNPTRTTTVPLRTTAIGGISTNLSKIDAVKRSAINELTYLVAKDKISAAEAQTRQSVITNAFAMYRFPWTTSKRQRYWTTAYGGAKDFLPDKVYYGLPYIQCGTNGNYTNRMYNVVKALNGGYFTKSSSNRYLMTSKRLNGMYVGNDCSAFVSMSTWGTSHAASYLATKYMATSRYYNTISGYDNLRPGDALVKGGSHTVMFLYFTDSAKTRMMIIEQGGGTNPGGSDMHNTVTCSVVNVSSYKNGGYVIRRATFLSRR
ncbi:MAG: Ig-like domain-containing protein [Christensenellales bacterium]